MSPPSNWQVVTRTEPNKQSLRRAQEYEIAAPRTSIVANLSWPMNSRRKFSIIFTSSKLFLKKPQVSTGREVIEKQFVNLDNVQPEYIHEYTEHFVN